MTNLKNFKSIEEWQESKEKDMRDAICGLGLSLMVVITILSLI